MDERWDGRWWVIRHEAPSTLPFTNGRESREVEERGGNLE